MDNQKVQAIIVQGACPYCGGWVLRGYKHYPGYQKCGPCSRVSWTGMAVVGVSGRPAGYATTYSHAEFDSPPPPPAERQLKFNRMIWPESIT